MWHCSSSICGSNDLADPMFDGVILAGFKSRANTFLLASAVLSLLLFSTIFPFSLLVGIVGLRSSD